MPTIPSKILSRLTDGTRRFQSIIEAAKIRDINESDTVVILTGVISELLGYDKYTDITTELAVRGTYCDLALKVNGKIEVLLEAKAVGIELKEPQVKQAVDYAANLGIEWVILTNAVSWRIYKVVFAKPIQNILVCEFNFLELKTKSTDDLEKLYLVSKEGVAKKSLEDYHCQKQATSKFILGNLLMTDSVITALRKELKWIFPEIKVSIDEIRLALSTDVMKREIVEGDEAEEARKRVGKALRKKDKKKFTNSLIQESSKIEGTDHIRSELEVPISNSEIVAE